MDVRNRKPNSENGNNGVQQNLQPPWRPRIPKFLNRRKVVPKKDHEEARNLSAAYSEHTWDLDKVVENHPNSRINLKNIQLSKGLSVSQAKELLEKNGPNELPKPKEISDLQLFLKQFLNLLWILLLVTDFFAALLYLYNPADTSQLWVTIIIFVMIFLMCCVSFKNEREARAVVRGFQNLLPENCVCIRDGKELTFSADELVVGDIIWIKNGTKVPADARVLYCSQLKLETSSITGEAEPIEYYCEPAAEGTTIFEAHNVAFNGSLCVDGEGVAVVIRTGTNTVIGQIADLTTGQELTKSRLEVQIRKFVIFLIIAAAVVGTLLFVIGGLVHNWKNIVFIMCQSYLVCAICLVPTGMPATVTSMIALVAKRLSERHVFIKRLDIVETLGSVNIIASDKTGTLTKNVMTVTDAWFLDEYISGVPQEKKTIMTNKIKNPLIPYEGPAGDILEIMTVCNSSKFLQEEDFLHTTIRRPKFDINVEMQKEKMNELRVTTGTPSEVAMLKYADQVIDVSAVRKSYNIVFEVPFNSKRKWHLMIAKLRNLQDGQAEYKLFIKGASEILVRKCSQIMTKNGFMEFDEECMNKFQAAYETFGSKGRRVIGFAEKIFNAPSNITFDFEKENFPLNGLDFAGICAIMDPPRDESAEAVEHCRTAGIKVFMVTGDHYLTAAAIAREIGLIVDIPGQERDYEIVHGEKISQLSENNWDELLKKRALVFARTTPEQKLLIVEKCQKRKLIIAMTGDGVNDAPALKKADIGIAMGSGSDVAKQAADIVLMNDNFASIVNAVQEGRIMFDNIKKLLCYVTIHSTPEIWPLVVNFFFGFPLGLSSLQILSIDLGTEIAPGIAFAKEPMEGDLMHRPPRRRNKIISSKTLLLYSYGYAGFIQSFGAFVAYCIVFMTYGIHLPDLFMSSVTYWQDNAPDFVSNNHTFTWQEQMHINRQACSAWFIGIVIGQLFHILNARTRRISIFKHGIFACPQSILGMITAVTLGCIIVYVPGVNTWFGGEAIGILPWLGAAGVGCFMFGFNEIRKYFIRNYPTNNAVRLFKW